MLGSNKNPLKASRRWSARKGTQTAFTWYSDTQVGWWTEGRLYFWLLVLVFSRSLPYHSDDLTNWFLANFFSFHLILITTEMMIRSLFARWTIWPRPCLEEEVLKKLIILCWQPSLTGEPEDDCVWCEGQNSHQSQTDRQSPRPPRPRCLSISYFEYRVQPKHLKHQKIFCVFCHHNATGMSKDRPDKS